MKFKRVSKKDRCEVCQSDTWCLYTEDACICMRCPSDRPYNFKNGVIGYWHSLNPSRARRWVPPKPAKETPKIDAEDMIYQWAKGTRAPKIIELAKELGVPASSLMDMGVVWSEDHSAFAFPMVNGFGKTVGIRLRGFGGRKWAVNGSKQGLFMTKKMAEQLKTPV